MGTEMKSAGIGKSQAPQDTTQCWIKEVVRCSVIVPLILPLGIGFQAARSQQFTNETDLRMHAAPTYGRELESADLDQDGDQDLVVAVAGPNGVLCRNLLLENDGLGFFSEVSTSFAGSDSSRGIDIGDLNGDGHLDLVVANRFQQDRILIGDGELGFTDVTEDRMPAEEYSRSRDAEMGDVDDDGDLDLHITRTAGNFDCLFWNDGAGGFARHRSYGSLVVNENDRFDAELEDLDGDGDLDLAVVILGGGNYPPVKPQFYENLGGAHYVNVTEGKHVGPGIPGRDMEVRDFDGDGDLDILAATTSDGPGGRDVILINDGMGAFTDESATRLPVVERISSGCAAGDLDQDGDLDIVVATCDGTTQLVYLENDGAGYFQDCTAGTLPMIEEDARDVVLADIDNDGDLDILVATRGDVAPERDVVLVNSAGADLVAPRVLYGVPHPNTSIEFQGYPVTVALDDNIELDERGCLLLYDAGQGATSLALNWIGGHLFRAVIPAQPRGSVVRYEVDVVDRSGNATKWPAQPLSFSIGSGTDLEISILGGSRFVAPGDSVLVETRVRNMSAEDRDFDVWCLWCTELPGCVRRIGELDCRVESGAEWVAAISYRVPRNAEEGRVSVRFLVGSYPLLLEDSHEIEVVIADEERRKRSD